MCGTYGLSRPDGPRQPLQAQNNEEWCTTSVAHLEPISKHWYGHATTGKHGHGHAVPKSGAHGHGNAHDATHDAVAVAHVATDATADAAADVATGAAADAAATTAAAVCRNGNIISFQWSDDAVTLKSAPLKT